MPHAPSSKDTKRERVHVEPRGTAPRRVHEVAPKAHGKTAELPSSDGDRPRLRPEIMGHFWGSLRRYWRLGELLAR